MSDLVARPEIRTLEEAVACYRLGLEGLPQALANDSSDSIVAIVLARDTVARFLPRAMAIPSEILKGVAEGDQTLAGASGLIAALSRTSSTLASLRRTVCPPSEAWWWFLDERGSPASPAWTALPALCIAVSLSLTAEISRRFLSGGPDFLSVLSILAQGMLAVLAGSTFTDAGRRWIERLVAMFGIERRFRPMWKSLVAAAVLLVVSGLMLALPSIARIYNCRGARLQRAGRITSALESYQRALSLAPDYPEAHYNLADAYESVLEYDKALGEYQRAIEGDDRFYHAYNNLARLYILHRRDHAGALKLVERAIALNPSEAQVRYSLYKNRAWANFELKLFQEAESDLGRALEIDPKGPAALCLLPQVLEAQARATRDAWEPCVAYAPSRPREVEASWLALARERAAQGG